MNTDPAVGYASSQLAYESIQEMQILTAGKPAEVGGGAGAYVNIVTKSGGNEFHGEGNFFWEHNRLQSDNLTPELEEQGLSRPSKITKFRDMSANLGGPIVRDRIWWYTSLRRWDTGRVIDGFPFDFEVKKHFVFAKGTTQLTDNNKLTLVYNRNGDDTPWRNASRFRSPEATFDSDEHVNVYKAQWTAILGENAFLDTAFARSARFWCLCWQADAGPGNYDFVTGMSTGSMYLQRINRRDRNQAKGTATWFVDDLAGGSHEFKYGLEWESAPFKWDVKVWNDTFTYTINGRPAFVDTVNTPVHLRMENRRLDAYAQDSWNIGGRMTLNLGLRVNHWVGVYPEQSSPGGRWSEPRSFPEEEALSWTSFDPRIGVAVDIAGDGRTVLRAGANRYHQKLIQQYYFAGTGNALGGEFRLWFGDLNGNGLVDPDEVSSPLAVWGGQTGFIDPDLEQPYTDEFTVGVERELFEDFSLGVNFIYKKDHQLLEDVNVGVPWDPVTGAPSYERVEVSDPGPDGVFGTPDDQTLTVFNQVANFGRDKFVLTNPAGAYRSYKGLEIIATKRMSRNWQLLGSLVIQKGVGNIGNNYGRATGVSSAYDNPNAMINIDGILPLDQTYQVKAQGTYQLPFGVNLSGYYRYFTGYPLYRALRVRLNQGLVTVTADPKDTHRLDGYHLVDLRVEKVFEFGRAADLGVMFDVFNLFNDNTVTSANSFTRIRGGFKRPLAIQAPRIARFGIRLIF